MQEFKTLLDGCNYQTHCPMCRSAMIMHEDQATIETKFAWSPTSKCTEITWHTSQHNSNINFVIQLETNQILSYQQTNNINPIYTMGSSTPAYFSTTNSSPFNGSIWVRLNFNCNSCGQYSYLLQICVNLIDKIIRTQLNSETFSFIEQDQLHEINNSYAQETSWYSVFTTDKEYYRAGSYTIKQPTIKLPLVPFDLNNPNKTLERIKSLLLYL